MLWRFGPTPGVTTLVAECADEAERDLVVDQSAAGVLTFDGQKATVTKTDGLWLRFLLDEPFRMPPLVIRFEDEEVASRIAAFGWYRFEVNLYRASLRAPGEVLLDQVFPTEPPPQYHGFAYQEKEEVTVG